MSLKPKNDQDQKRRRSGMEFKIALLAVREVEVSKKFYGELFEQKVMLDLGKNVTFSGGFAIQQDFAQLTNVAADSVMCKSHNMAVSYTHLRAHETRHDLVCRLLL